MTDNSPPPFAELNDGELHVMQFNPTYEGFGMVMDFVARKKPFADFEAGRLVEALHEQLKFGHHLVAMEAGKIVGYAGWLLTTSEIAEGWVHDRARLVRKSGEDATAAALTIVISDQPEAVARLIRGARRLNPGKRAYFKRGGNGRRPARKLSLPV